ncbi:unnamed protein product, partial [Hapterophycus canaliculatus]
LAANVKAVQPLYAWDDPQAEYPGLDARPSDHQHHRRKSQPSFYDQEALQEQLRNLQYEGIVLAEKKDRLDLRLTNAQATLSDMRAKKRELSQAKLMEEAAAVLPATTKTIGAAGVRAAFGRDRATDLNGSGSSTREARAKRHQDNANFAAQDRIMELELLNNQLKKGQAEVERKAKLQQAASCSTKAEVQKAAERLRAMPKRFTQSLQLLRDEVDQLEREKLGLELARQQRTSQANLRTSPDHTSDDHLLTSASRRQAYLREELTSLVEEIDDVEDDRDRWKRRLRVENTCIESLRSQRDEALRDLRTRFGSDAVERAAFAFFAESGQGGGAGTGAIDPGSGGRCSGGFIDVGGGGRGDLDEDDDRGSGGNDNPDRCPMIPVSVIARALRPAYGVGFYDDDGCDGGDAGGAPSSRRRFEAAVAEALLSECGLGCPSRVLDQEKEEGGNGDQCSGMVTFDEFRAVARRLEGSTL